MKLSARAFNNILIFAMLAMIMLFNIDTWLPRPEADSRLRLIEENDLVLKVQLEDARLERIGTDWRVINPAIQGVDAQEVIQAWHSARLTLAQLPTDPLTQYSAQVWLAGNPDAVQLTFWQTPNVGYVEIGANTYRLEDIVLKQLLF
ncbi:hypothetical protein QTP81_01500 [Alteromonas sp. ASW11-36]|uniref:DUF4340 domain-containing protein n=1 Tax=Alteromonas arenosi TaxID=3055817 RepID=A0ABT7STG5_9ALTE|nr:hypothetical protein [Alteromonas sp. ASW11-36]MDM7859279.1 hypothetical protein [Alteromonas sp. ASW11-36]